MTRNLITVFANDRKSYRNIRTSIDDYPLLHIERPDVEPLKIDLSHWLESGETISSVSVTPDNATVSTTNDTTSITLNISGVRGDGEIDVIATLSSGKTYIEKVKCRNRRQNIIGQNNVKFFATVAPSNASLTLSGKSPALSIGQIVQPANASLAISGYVPTIEGTIIVRPDQATLTIEGKSPSIAIDQIILPSNASLTVTGYAPIATGNQLVTPANATLTVTGQVPIVTGDQLVTPANASLTITGRSPALIIDQIITPANASITVTGRSPSIAIDQIVEPANASLTITGQTPIIAVSKFVLPGNASLTVTGQAPQINIDEVVKPANASITVTGQVPTIDSSYTANSVRFDGTNDYLTRGANLTGAADGKEGTVSFWINLKSGDSTGMRILATDSSNTGFVVARDAVNKINVFCYNTSSTRILKLESNTSVTTSSGWTHILASWNLATTTSYLYMDDTDDTNETTNTNDTIDYTRGEMAVGSWANGTSKLDADIADFWFDDSYIDISNVTNRRKFIDASGKPEPLGASGSTPTGSDPLIFLSGDTSSWHTNKGSGGGFTENGALADGTDSPSD